MKIGTKLTIAFVLGLLIIGALGVQSYRAIQQLTESNGWVIHTHEVMEKLERVELTLTDAESGARGFVLTGDDTYLKPYNAATAEIEKDIAAVTVLTQDNPEQQKSLQQLEELSREKLEILQGAIKRRRDEGPEAASAVIRTDRGERVMEDLRALVVQMELREQGLLEARNRAASEVTRRTMLMLGSGVLLSLIVLGIAAVIVIRTMRLADRSMRLGGAGRKWPGIALQYAFAVAAVAMAAWLKGWMERNVGPMPVFVTFYPAVLLVATVAGGGPGMLTTALSALAADYWFIAPTGSFGIGATNDAVALGIFAGTGIFLSLLAERLRRARQAEAVSAGQEQELALQNLGNLMALDLDHRILRWSEGNRRLYGFDAQETLGKVAHELLQTHFDRPLEQVHSELLEKDRWEGEVTQHSKDGTQLSVALLWALRRDERGKPVDILEVSTDISLQKAAEESLRQQSEELAQQNEELSRQTEELAQQAEELSDQNEELETQAEEIQALNAELGHREKTLQTLLDSARLPMGEQQVLGKVCQAAREMIGPDADAAVVCERIGDELHVLAHVGLDGAGVPRSWPVKGSFVEMMIEQNRTASLEDLSLRPDLKTLPVPNHQRFGAALAAPLKLKGRPVGAVTIYSNTPQQWTAEQFRLIEWLAAQCSNALEAIRLQAEVRQGQQQNEFLANILETSSQAFGVGYPDGRLGLTNKAFEELTGYSRAELQSLDWTTKLTPPDWRERERQKLDELRRTGRPVRYEKEYVRKDGTRVPIELLVHLAKNAEGKPLYYYSFVTDITERKQAEETLKESEAKYRNLFENMTEEVHFWKLVRNGDGQIKTWRLVDANPPTLKSWGRKSVEEIRGKTTDEIFGPGATEHYMPVVQKVITEGVPHVFEDYFPNLDKYFRFTTVPLGDYFITTGADISGIKKAQIETATASEFLKIINQSASTRELVKAVVKFFRRQSGCEAVGVRLHEGEDYPYYEAHGFPEEFLKLENSLCERDVAGEVQRDNVGNPCIACMCGNVICGRFDPSKPFFSPQGSFWTNCTTDLLAGTTEADRQAKTRNRCNGQGYESVALIPLRAGDERLGLIQFNDKRKGRFTAQTIALWERLASYLAVALAKARAEEHVRELSRRLTYHADNSPLAVIEWGPDMRLTRWSGAAERIFGWKAEEVLGKRMDEFRWIYKEDAAQVAEVSDDLTSGANPKRFSVNRNYRKDGSVVHCEWYNSSLMDESGKLRSILSLVLDVTERKYAESALQTTLQRFYTVLSSMYSGILLVTDEGRVEFANQAFCDRFGLKEAPANLVGLESPVMIERIKNGYQYSDESVARIREIVERGEPVKGEELAMKDGGACLRDFVPLNVRGKSYGRLWIHVDITERKQAEEALRTLNLSLEQRVTERTAELERVVGFLREEIAERKRMESALRTASGYNRSLIEASLDPLVTIGADGKIMDVNAATEAVTGASRTQLVGSNFLDYFTEPEKADAGYRRVLAEGHVRDYPLTIRHASGGATNVLYHATVYRNDAGDVQGVFAAARDITERKKAERELAERSAEVQHQADQLRALAVELSQTEQRERKRLSAILHDHIQQLLVAAQLQLSLVERTGPQTVQATVQGIRSTIAEAIAASRSLTVELSPPILHQSGLTAALTWLAARNEEKYLFKVHVRANSDAEPADPDVRALLFNSVQELLLNAVKHSGVREAQLIMRRSKEAWTQIIVEDKGKGFDPSTISAHRGGGFGLFSIQQRLAYLGGRLEVESAPGRGARFVLMIPIGQAAAKDAASAAPAAPPSERAPFHPRSRKISVLLVDDHRIMRQGLSSLLQFEEDIEVVGEAENGRQAVELAHQHAPDVIIMDVNMPVMDGIEATRIVTKEMPRIKVIALSMHQERDTAEAMRQAGAVAYLTKGGPSDDLIAAIRACSRSRTMES